MIANNNEATANPEQILMALPELSKDASPAPSKKRQSNPAPDAPPPDASPRQRETGDQVNGFMLCALVSQSAKRLKGRAERIGVSLPMSVITRSILNAYLAAAKDHHGPFANAEPDFAMIQKVNEQVLQEVLARHSRDKLNHRTPPAQANRYGDDPRR